ncbi:MAG: tetratricopeptide repeat protein [Solirubrobacteraceae bacterium]
MPGSILVPSIVPSWTSRPVSDPSRMSRLVSDPSEHWTKQIVRGDLDWRWEGVVHEHLVSDAERSSRRLAGAAVHTWNVGAARTGRWHRDRELLEAHLERAPQDARARFYLAQTHRELGEPRRAIEHYRRRALLGGWAEEVYYPLLQIGVLSAELGDWPTALDALCDAWEVRPGRLEAAYELASRLRVRRRYRAAHRFASLAAALTPLPVPEDVLHVAPWVYRWGLLFEYSITSYWVGEPDRSIAACDALLALGDLPEEHRAQTVRNRRFALDAKARRLVARTTTPTRRSRL